MQKWHVLKAKLQKQSRSLSGGVPFSMSDKKPLSDIEKSLEEGCPKRSVGVLSGLSVFNAQFRR
jgi:hypothetical protein